MSTKSLEVWAQRNAKKVLNEKSITGGGGGGGGGDTSLNSNNDLETAIVIEQSELV